MSTTRFVGLAYRAHDPRWAFAPLSGEGARLRGGRFNPVGTPALYLATTIEGMFAEMGHGLARRFEPLTVCTYEIDCADIVDLSTASARESLGVEDSALAAPWALDRAEGQEPRSWTVARRFIAEKAAGLLVPSFAIGAPAEATNLVLFRWGEQAPHAVKVHDPAGKLPRDGSSWS